MARSGAERVREHREREKLAKLDADAGKPWKGLIGEEREQAIRDHFGYAKSETRTQAERQAAADGMLAKARAVSQDSAQAQPEE